MYHRQPKGQLLAQEGEFSLWATSPVYKTLFIETGFIRNKITGENCGKTVELCKHYYSNGQQLDEPVYDDADCYEFVFEDISDE